MAKKDKRKANRGEAGNSADDPDLTALLQIPPGLYGSYRLYFDTPQKRNKFWRDVYKLVDDNDTTFYSLEHLNVSPKGNIPPDNDDDDSSDDRGYPVKLCDEGP